ncbi:MAG: glycosidase-like protein [Acidimicrobiaceae bacterium]|nr:glycosidase-like protein [Acidimicrobiaceae bacterium]
MNTTNGDLVSRSDLRLFPDPSRVVAQLFVPGLELVLDRESRATGVLSRILELPEETVITTLETISDRFTKRHRDLPSILLENYQRVMHRVLVGATLTKERQMLVGASFTKEYSVEASALFNPSLVPHPDQSDLDSGAVRFVMSLRAVGEGHLSSVEFRTGTVGPGHNLKLDIPGRFLDAGRHLPTVHDRALFQAKIAETGNQSETSSFLMKLLPHRFDNEMLEAALSDLAHQSDTRRGEGRIKELVRRIAASNYEVVFDETSPLSERILWPYSDSESHGIEDARFVQFINDDDSKVYYATYTAFDGEQVAPNLIETADFRHFKVSQLAGPAAKNKGMALFPRKIDGNFVALSRWDRENNAIATSADGRVWKTPTTLSIPEQTWEIIQLGNAGSPIETEAGWLVITHGVGPMREYSLGAILLDIHDPCKVIGRLKEPLMRPEEDERDGYVPNVVYSCGAMAFGDQLLLPYGVSDSSIGFAFLDVPKLLDRLTSDNS